MIKTLLISLTMAGAIIPSIATGFSFPEIGFCPEGGPPGWFNSMFDQHDRRYYGSPPPMFRPVYPAAPANGWQSPVMLQPPVYSPRKPATH